MDRLHAVGPIKRHFNPPADIPHRHAVFHLSHHHVNIMRSLTAPFSRSKRYIHQIDQQSKPIPHHNNTSSNTKSRCIRRWAMHGVIGSGAGRCSRLEPKSIVRSIENADAVSGMFLDSWEEKKLTDHTMRSQWRTETCQVAFGWSVSPVGQGDHHGWRIPIPFSTRIIVIVFHVV